MRAEAARALARTGRGRFGGARSDQVDWRSAGRKRWPGDTAPRNDRRPSSRSGSFKRDELDTANLKRRMGGGADAVPSEDAGFVLGLGVLFVAVVVWQRRAWRHADSALGGAEHDGERQIIPRFGGDHHAGRDEYL